MSHKIRLTEDHLVLANIGERYWDVRLSQIPEDLDYRGFLVRFIDKLRANLRNGYGLLLWGDNGTGKTSAGVILLKAVMGHGGTGLFMTCDEFVDAKFSKREFSEEQTFVERAQTVDLLVIDDLGMENVSEFSKRAVENLVRKRSNRKRSTVITSNVSPKIIGSAEGYGKSLLSVLGACIFPVPVTGKNWREEQAAKLRKAVG